MNGGREKPSVNRTRPVTDGPLYQFKRWTGATTCCRHGPGSLAVRRLILVSVHALLVLPNVCLSWASWASWARPAGRKRDHTPVSISSIACAIARSRSSCSEQRTTKLERAESQWRRGEHVAVSGWIRPWSSVPCHVMSCMHSAAPFAATQCNGAPLRVDTSWGIMPVIGGPPYGVRLCYRGPFACWTMQRADACMAHVSLAQY